MSSLADPVALLHKEVGKLVAVGDYQAATEHVVRFCRRMESCPPYLIDGLLLLAGFSVHAPQDQSIRDSLFPLLRSAIIGTNDYLATEPELWTPASRAASLVPVIKACLIAANLSLVHGDIATAKEFLANAADFAASAALADLPRALCKARNQGLIWSLIHDLVVLNDSTHARAVLVAQWEFLNGPLALPSEANQHRGALIEAMAEAKLGDLYADQANAPSAASSYARSANGFRSINNLSIAVTGQVVWAEYSRVKELMHDRDTCGPWVSAPAPEPAQDYRDAASLRKELLLLFENYAEGLVKRDAAAVTKCIFEAERHSADIQSMLDQVAGDGVVSMKTSGLSSTSGIPLDRKVINVTWHLVVETKPGKRTEFEKACRLVETPSGWKLDLGTKKVGK